MYFVMPKRYSTMKIVLLFLSLICGFCFGQETDELSSKFKHTNQDRLKMAYASELAWKLRDQNPDSSLFYAKIALQLSKKLGNKKTEAYSLSDIGTYYKHQEHYTEAQKYFKKSLRIRKTIGENNDIASGYNQLGLLFRQQEQYDSAVVYFRKGIDLLPHEKSTLKSNLLDGYGMSLLNLGQYKHALHYIQQSLKIAEELEDSLSIAKSHQNLGVIYEKQGVAKLALTEFKSAEQLFSILKNQNGLLESIINQASINQQLGKIINADKMYQKAELLSIKHGFQDNLPTIWFNRAELFLESDPKKSIYFYKKALKNATSYEKPLLKTECLLGLMDASIRADELNAAKQWKLQLEEQPQLNRTAIRKDFLELCVKYYRKSGDLESAFRYSQDLLKVRDSLDKIVLNNLETLSLLEKSRNKEKIAREEINRLKVIKQSEEDQSQMWFLTMGIIMILLIVSLITFFLIYKIRLDNKNAVLREQELQQEMTDLIHESDLRVMEESLLVEGKTRKNIGKDLHDNLGSKLAVVQIMLDSFRRKTEESRMDLQEKLIKAIQLIEDSCNDLRTISRNMVNTGISETSLADSVDTLCRFISENSQIEIVFHYENDIVLQEMHWRKNILSTISLLLHNIIKHSDASKAEITLLGDETQLSIIIKDNGKGFDTNKLDQVEGVGLRNARERVEIMKGTIQMTSEKGNGTNILIQLPSK